VRTGLEPEAVEAAAREIDADLARAGFERSAFLVQEMIENGVEMLIGVVDDPIFGPAVACGAGGIEAELLRDVAVRLSPLTAHDATEMIESLALHPRLTGYRGSEPLDVRAVEQMVLRVGDMVETHREIAELDLNPVIVRPDGAIAVDARVRIRRAPERRSWPSTWRSRAPGAGA
jgi:acyl-CoA synthetase (NDP forming)